MKFKGIFMRRSGENSPSSNEIDDTAIEVAAVLFIFIIEFKLITLRLISS